MKIIEDPGISTKPSASGRLARLRDTFKLGRVWAQDMQAQDEVIAALSRSLSNSFVLLRNVSLEGLEIPIPLVLVSPQAVRVLYASALRGVYRAREDVWEEMDDRQQRYRTVSPNLVTRTLLMARAVQAYLQSHGQGEAEVEPVLVFSDPGLHVESVRPAVRVVMVDAMERFIAGLQQGRTAFSSEEVQKIVDILARQVTDTSEPEEPVVDAFSFRDEEVRPRKVQPVQTGPSRADQLVEPLKKIPLTTRQWVVLGLFTLFNILLLIGFVVLVLVTSQF